MPYRSYKRRLRRYRRRRKYRSRKRKASLRRTYAVAKAAYRLAATSPKVFHGTGVESVYATGSTNAPYFVLLNGIAQGTGDGTRESEYIMNSHHNIRFSVNSGAATDNVGIRIIIYCVPKNNNVNYGYTNVIKYTSITGSITSAEQILLSPYNDDNGGQFKVWYDRTYYMQNNADNQKIFGKIHLKKKIRTKYSGTSAAATDVETNAVYMMVFSNVIDMGNAPVFSYQRSFYYYD